MTGRIVRVIDFVAVRTSAALDYFGTPGTSFVGVRNGETEFLTPTVGGTGMGCGRSGLVSSRTAFEAENTLLSGSRLHYSRLTSVTLVDVPKGVRPGMHKIQVI